MKKCNKRIVNPLMPVFSSPIGGRHPKKAGASERSESDAPSAYIGLYGHDNN